jgi:hypothetical protein
MPIAFSDQTKFILRSFLFLFSYLFQSQLPLKILLVFLFPSSVLPPLISFPIPIQAHSSLLSLHYHLSTTISSPSQLLHPNFTYHKHHLSSPTTNITMATSLALGIGGWRLRKLWYSYDRNGPNVSLHWNTAGILLNQVRTSYAISVWPQLSCISGFELLIC